MELAKTNTATTVSCKCCDAALWISEKEAEIKVLKEEESETSWWFFRTKGKHKVSKKVPETKPMSKVAGWWCVFCPGGTYVGFYKAKQEKDQEVLKVYKAWFSVERTQASVYNFP